MKLKEGLLDFGRTQIPIILPVNTEILTMKEVPLLKDAEPVLNKTLQSPVGCPPLQEIVQQKLQRNSNAHAVIVLSDNTRPVPYSGENGILFPIIETLIKGGLSPDQISMLIASGTHRAMKKEELEEMIDLRVIKTGIDILSHNSQKTSEFVFLGNTTKGTKALINRHYIESDIKILTGLVESHFMTGVSGGRKSICPGLAAIETIFTLHSSPYLNSPKARDLVLEGNPCHQDALEIAKMAPPDMIINVTLDRNYNLTGIFAGELEQAHLEAVKKLQNYVTIPAVKKYDLVITHGGYVGVNHYQLAKAAVIASYIIKEEGFCILAASMSDPDPIGSSNYKNLISKLKELGTKNFLNLILDPSWIFVPDQWQVQMWGHLFTKIPQENLIYCCEELPEDASIYLPGRDVRTIVQGEKSLQKLVEYSIDYVIQELRHISGKEPTIAFLADGPYGIPILMDIERNK